MGSPSRKKMEEKTLASRLEFRPHPDAPIFDRPLETVRKEVADVISLMASQNPQFNKEAVELVRQLGLVNLWFYLKFILGAFGPYDELNDGLHVDMCNFRQSDLCMAIGALFAAFIPRGMYKSTIDSHGADTWELQRNPDLRIGLINAIEGRAVDFFKQVKNNFQYNELLHELYPESRPLPNMDRWNNSEIVMPNRSKFMVQPSLKPMGATGSAEGEHFDLANIDDLVGMDELNSEFQINASMMQKTKWFKVAKKALRVDRSSRIGVVATRYAVDDPYQIIVDSCKTLVGFSDEDIPERPDGEWAIYYRMAIEDGKAIFPEVMDEGEYERLLEEDYWTAITQYANSPKKTGLAEFFSMDVKRAKLHYVEEQWWIEKLGDSNFDGEVSRIVRLGSCDVVMACDPAATDSGISAKTSKTAITVWALDSDGDYTLIWERAGYFSVHDTFNHIFLGHETFPGYIRSLVVESNAYQKVLAPLIREERFERDTYINVSPQPAQGDKDARIRSRIGNELQKGKVYVAEGVGTKFIEEMRVFPMSKYKKDVLDSSEKAMSNLVLPPSEDDEVLKEFEEEDERVEMADNLVGY